MLGNRIGLPYGGYMASLAKLVKNAGGVLYLDARKSDGVKPGINTPFTNPLIDLTKLGNDATLTSFAATQTDGFTLEATVNSNGSEVGYSNLVTNPTFVDTSGWTTSGIASLSVSGNEATLTGLGTGNQPNLIGGNDGKTYQSGDKFNMSCEVNIPSGCTSVALVWRDTTLGITLNATTLTPTVFGSYIELNGIITLASQSVFGRLQIVFTFPDNTTANGKVMKIRKCQSVQLNTPQITAFETNQLGKPLDAPACDRIFPFVATTGTTLVSARPYIATDGIDSYGLLSNSPSVDITGLEEFELAWCGITGSTITESALLSKGLDTEVTSQYYLFIFSDGKLGLNLNGNVYQLAPTGSIKSNTSYDIRTLKENGRLKCWINGVLTYDQPNVVALTSRPNFRLFSRATNAVGTTHFRYFKGLTAYLILARGTYGDLGKLDAVLDKLVKDYRTVI